MNERYKKGWKILQEINKPGADQFAKELNEVEPDLMNYVVEYAFGEIFSRPGLERKTREIATIASLVTMGRLQELKFHVNTALNVGCTESEIKEVILQMSVYAGIPAAIEGMLAAKTVFEQRNREK